MSIRCTHFLLRTILCFPVAALRDINGDSKSCILLTTVKEREKKELKFHLKMRGAWWDRWTTTSVFQRPWDNINNLIRL